jgi:MFS family permease
MVEIQPIRDRARLQRRTLRVLVAGQVFAAIGGAGAAAGTLLAYEISGSAALASLPLAFIVAGSAASVIPISALSRRAGRRAGLSVALATATVGAAAVVVAGAADSFLLLCAASVVFGVGNTAVLLARYAAADLSEPAERGRAIGRVVFATTFGGVAGPNLLAPAGDVATAVGLPRLTGLFLFAGVAFAVGGLILFAFLRPDPLQMAIAFEPKREKAAGLERVPLRVLLAPVAATTGLATIVTANFVMVAVMTMAPLHMQQHGHSLEFVGLVVSLHVAGMFAPSPITGYLTDRVGSPPVAALCGLLLMIAGILSAIGGHSSTGFAIGLVLLGVGWNAGLIAGSTLLASAVPARQRPRAEGVGDLCMGVAAATATAIAGPVVGAAGYATLALAGAVAAATLGPFLLATIRRPPTGEAVRASRLLT